MLANVCKGACQVPLVLRERKRRPGGGKRWFARRCPWRLVEPSKCHPLVFIAQTRVILTGQDSLSLS